MKKLIFSIACTLVIASCITTTESGTQNANAIDTATVIVGADKDDHGCKGSAGYTYSQLLQDCIRTWEIGIMLNPVSTTQQDVNIISVVFNKDNTKAELFILDVKGTEILNQTSNTQYSNAIYTLALQAGKWQLSKNNIIINKQ